MRYYGQGWHNEPYRHSLAAQGVKTSFAKTGKAIGFAGTELGKTLVAGFQDDSPRDSSYDREDYMEDVDSVMDKDYYEEDKPLLSAKADLPGDVPVNIPQGSDVLVKEEEEPLFDSFLPEDDLEDKPHTFEDKVKDEVDQLSSLVDLDPILFEEKTESIFNNILFDVNFYLKDGDVEKLKEQVVRLNAQKQLYKDKIKIVDNLRQDILSKKYYEDTSMANQFEDINEVDDAIEGLMVKLNNIDLAQNKLKTQISGMERNQNFSTEKQFSSSESIIPSFREVFGMSPPESRVPTSSMQPKSNVVTPLSSQEESGGFFSGVFSDVMKDIGEGLTVKNPIFGDDKK